MTCSDGLCAIFVFPASPPKCSKYEAYLALNLAEGKAIVAEAQEGVVAARCVHRVGRLALGEVAIWIGVTAGHRRGVPGLPIHHRRGEAPGPDLEERALPGRELGVDRPREPSLLRAHRAVLNLLLQQRFHRSQYFAPVFSGVVRRRAAWVVFLGDDEGGFRSRLGKLIGNGLVVLRHVGFP